MLVLSRREDEKLVFPNLGITITIAKICGKSVRVGVDAPRHVRVLRQEIADAAEAFGTGDQADTLSGGVSSHRLRNRLNKLQVGLHLLQRQCEAEMNGEAERTLQILLAESRALDEEVAVRKESTARQKTRRALLVEDDANESELLAGFLRVSGFDVDVANDGCDALDYLATSEPPHVVLLDMQMPRCDGRTTLSAIRKNPDYGGLRVFGVSGMAPEQLGIPLGPEGVDRWFTKPVNPESLVREMHRQLEAASENTHAVCG